MTEIRRDGDWARLLREFSRAQLTPENVGELLNIEEERASALHIELKNRSIITLDELLTASTRIQEDPASGDFSAKGDLASVTVKGALRQIAALRDRVGK